MKLVIEKMLYSLDSFNDYKYYVADCSYSQIEESEKIYKIDVISDGKIELSRYVNGEKKDVDVITYDECAVFSPQCIDGGECYKYMLFEDDKAVVDYLNEYADKNGTVYWLGEPSKYMLVVETDTERFAVCAAKGFIPGFAGDKYKFRIDEISDRILITAFIKNADVEALLLCEDNNYQVVFGNGKGRITAFSDYASAQKLFAESEWGREASEDTATSEDVEWEW